MRWSFVVFTLLGSSFFATYNVATYHIIRARQESHDIQLRAEARVAAVNPVRKPNVKVDERDLLQLQMQHPEEQNLDFVQFFYTKGTCELYEVMIQRPGQRAEMIFRPGNGKSDNWQRWEGMFESELMRTIRFPKDEVAVGFSAVA